ncbi:MAG: arginine repressor [Clostridia bacterium]|jgi:transcriptional regulator of arginine metabolism|nr:arginine repressor [Clostridia bacterium]MCI1959531.1 arginine repressor [Clostridia bacterium]MCI2000929.1 arginine repressor [Clostridia bacterium]MCI2015713.1 arginine repressor [Clostridia bacterium]
MKIARHTKILEIIENNEVETQEELARLLKQEGFNVTQATISRDIREMKLTKILTENGGQKYSAINGNDSELSERLIRVFRDAVVKFDCAQNMIVIKTLDGMGMAVAVAVDNLKSNDIIGSIAGDDTVFCVARTHNQAVEFVQKLSHIIESGK